MLPVEQPFKTYTGLDGKPLNNGSVYFGVAGQDPIAHPVTVYWDAAGTLPVSQPARTVNGYIVNDANAPANVFCGVVYSEAVYDSKGRQVFYAQTSAEFSVATIADQLIKQAIDILYFGVKNPCSPTYAGGAVGDGVANDYAALAACYADTSSPFVTIPADKTFLINSTLAVPSGTITTSAGGKIIGPGNIGLFSLTYPSVGTVFDGLVLDGRKTSGTTDVVTLIYAAGSVTTPTDKSRRLIVRNCTLRNASAGVAFENAQDCAVHDNHIEAMYRHTTGPYAGSYGYGVVFNGCTNSKIHGNTIGTSDLPCERHGVYLPVFRNSDVAPTVLNFCSSIQIANNRISVKHDPANEPYSSCVESWNYFDISIVSNHLIGGVRGINSAPDYQNGSRVQIIGNLIKDSEICIRNGPTDKGAAPGTYYFDEYQIIGNTMLPLSTIAGQQGVFMQGVKKIVFNDNYVRGTSSNTFAFGYYDLTNNIVAELISCSGNVIAGFAQGFYLANVAKFADDSSFELFTGNPLPYVRVANIGQSEMEPKLSPFTSLYAYNTVDWTGVRYYEAAIEKYIRNNGSYWVDSAGLRVRGPTANRPSNVSVVSGAAAFGADLGLPYGFRYYDEGAGAMVYWNGVTWATSQQPAIPIAGTTSDLNTFKATYPGAMNYGAPSWNTTTAKPVWFNALSNNWVYSDGTAI